MHGVSSEEHERFEAVFRAHHDAVLAYLRRRADPETARDTLAETFLIAWRRRHEIPAQPRPWLYGVARRTLANHRRSADRRSALHERLRSAARPPETSGEVEPSPVTEALWSLSERDREVLMLHAWEGLSRSEAAKVLGCREVAYGVRLHRARRRLEAALPREPPAAPREAGEVA